MSTDMKITVDDLIAVPFSSRSQEMKERIVLDGRPKPSIKIPSVVKAGDAEKSTYKYRLNIRDKDLLIGRLQTMYDEILWLTACTETKRLHCWPCLLFHPPGLWNKTDVSNAVLMKWDASEHEKTYEHIDSMFRLQTFINQTSKTKDVKSTVKNFETVKRLTDVVCSLASIQPPPNNSDNAPSSLEVEKCVKTLMLLRKYDSLSKYYSDNAINLIKTSPESVHRMVEVIAKFMRLNIAKEISSSKYVSLILSQHSNVKLQAQISSILRYVINGKVVERFLGFTHVFSTASADSICEYLKSLVDEYDIGTKCIALSLDGSIIPSSEVQDLCRKLKSDVQHCIFVPWHSHKVDDILQKSLSTHPKCEHFFKTMVALETYFCENYELSVSFNNSMPKNRLQDITFQTQCAGNWFVTSQFLAYVLENRQHFVLFFECVIANSSKWNADLIAKAFGFRENLQDLLTVFLLNVFTKIFRLTSDLRTALDSDVPERNFGKGIELKLVNDLKLMRNEDFKPLMAHAVKETGKKVHNIEKHGFISLFEEIMKLVIEEVEMRYTELDKLHFCSIFNFEEEAWFEQATSRMQDIEKLYDFNFSQPLFLNEMELLSKHNAFSKRCVYDFHQYLLESNLKHTFKALFDCSELILTMPFKPASLNGGASVLDKIGKWSFGPGHTPSVYDTSIVFVESGYLQEIKQLPNFYNDVYAKFSL